MRKARHSREYTFYQQLLTLINLSLCTFLIAISSATAEIDSNKPTVLITGSNQGIGFGFVKAFADKGWNVIATCRSPDKAQQLKSLAQQNKNIVIEALDVTDLAQITALAKKYENQSIDILLNNAGIQGDVAKQKLGAMDYDTFRQVIDVNTFGPIAVADAFIPHVESSETKKIINISSYMGSIDKTFGILYSYRASKAALNMMMKTLSKEVRRKGIIIGILDPGVVDTNLTEWPNGKPKNMLQVDDSVAAMMILIDGYDKKTSGTFYRYDGKELPW